MSRYLTDCHFTPIHCTKCHILIGEHYDKAMEPEPENPLCYSCNEEEKEKQKIKARNLDCSRCGRLIGTWHDVSAKKKLKDVLCDHCQEDDRQEWDEKQRKYWMKINSKSERRCRHQKKERTTEAARQMELSNSAREKIAKAKIERKKMWESKVTPKVEVQCKDCRKMCSIRADKHPEIMNNQFRCFHCCKKTGLLYYQKKPAVAANLELYYHKLPEKVEDLKKLINVCLEIGIKLVQTKIEK